MRKKTMGRTGVAWMRAAGVSAALALGGCLSVPIPQAEADPARFYVLSTTGAAAPVSPPEGAPGVHLQSVEVASYLRSRPMIVRRGNNEIQFREFARWGEPLELGVERVLREELLARGAASHVVTGGLRPPNMRFDYTASVRVLACEGGADGSVLFRAAWEVVPERREGADAGATPKRGEFRPTDLRWDGKTEGSLAAQLSAAVAGLAGEIATAMKRP